MSASRPAWMSDDRLTRMATPSAMDMAEAQLAREILRQDAEIATMTAHIDRLKDDAEQFNVRLADMARQRDVLHGSVEELRAERAKLTERVRFIEEENIESGKEMAAAIEDRERTNRRWREDTAAMESMRTEIATLTAEVAKLREHSDHDAGEILRLAGEVDQHRLRSESRRDLAASLLAERDAARAETACKGCGGTVGHHLAPDQGGCPGRFVIDGVPMVPVAHVDAARAEVERLTHQRDDAAAKLGAVTLTGDSVATDSSLYRGNSVRYWWDKCQAYRDAFEKRDAAIRDRNEFAASEVERFAKEFLDVVQLHGVTAAVEALPGAADNRAAELRKAAGAAAPVDLAIHGSDRTVTMRVVDGKVEEVSTPPADRQPAKRCGSFGCVLPAGHNMGKADVPENHHSGQPDDEVGRLKNELWCSETNHNTALDLLDEERAKVANLTARLAASEKAKRNLLAAAEMALGVIWSDTKTTAQEAVAKLVQCRDALRAAIAAERAGGAS